jgi:hypothetical protein
MNMRRLAVSVVFLLAILGLASSAPAKGLGIPTSRAGLGFGNLPRFDGVRLNLRDRDVDCVRGVNLTLWAGEKNKQSTYLGANLGLAPSGGRLTGLNVGLLGVGADRDLRGVTVGLLGAGAGNNVAGVTVGVLGGGAGQDLRGVTIGGLGAGAGRNIRGIVIGGLGAGAGENLAGIAVGGLGCGAGKSLRGLVIGGLGGGAGEDLDGIAIGGLGAGAGRHLRGVAVGLVGVGAGEAARGVLIGGLRVEAKEIQGVSLSANTRVRPGGRFTGLAAGAFNQIRGEQAGLAIGLVNYARRLHGLQLGVVNCVRGNPSWRRILPIVNW